MRIVVVGAGLLGAATAYHLARHGADVVVVEAATVGGAASRASFTWLNAQGKAPEAYFALNVAGIAEHARLADELGDGAWLHGGGDLQVGAGEAGERIRAAVGPHASARYPVRLISRSEAAELEPDLALPDGDATFAWYPEEGWIEAATLAGRLLAEARKRRAEVTEGAAVRTLTRDRGGAVDGVTLDSGATIAADAVVVAGGTGSATLAATAGVRIPMAPTPGLLVVTSPSAAGPRRVVHAQGMTLRPDGAGRTMLASRTVDASLPADVASISPDGPEASGLLERAVRAYPGMAGASVETARIGWRSVAADGMPVVGPVEGVGGLYLLVSHSGATLAPLLGRLAARELTDSPAVELLPYRLTATRFGG